MQESTEVVDPCYLQISKVAHLGQRHVCGGHNALLGVEIEEDFKRFAYMHVDVGAYLAIGQEHFAILFTAVQVESELHLPVHLELACASYLQFVFISHIRSSVCVCVVDGSVM